MPHIRAFLRVLAALVALFAPSDGPVRLAISGAGPGPGPEARAAAWAGTVPFLAPVPAQAEDGLAGSGEKPAAPARGPDPVGQPSVRPALLRSADGSSPRERLASAWSARGPPSPGSAPG